MALAAGVGALGVAWGYHPAVELRRAGAHAVIEACGGLPAAVDDYFTRGERAA
jgi:phosphoglycolate phosphatase